MQTGFETVRDRQTDRQHYDGNSLKTNVSRNQLTFLDQRVHGQCRVAASHHLPNWTSKHTSNNSNYTVSQEKGHPL